MWKLNSGHQFVIVLSQKVNQVTLGVNAVGRFRILNYPTNGLPQVWHLRCDLTKRSSERSDTSIHSRPPSLQIWQ
ncbi:MAG: hypothetical protein ACRD9Q_00870 [Nitrososphaeraceae archaeon]